MLRKNATNSVRESHGSRILGPSVAFSARSLIDRILRPRHLRENTTPSDGIFYVIRSPSGWELYPYRYDEFPSIDHSELWDEYVVPILAHNWASVLKVQPIALEKRLKLHTYGFPRGRVSRNGRKFTVHYGNDFTKLGIGKPLIERAFSISVAKWETDEHEQCQGDDAKAVQAILRLKDRWPVVSSSFGFDD